MVFKLGRNVLVGVGVYLNLNALPPPTLVPAVDGLSSDNSGASILRPIRIIGTSLVLELNRCKHRPSRPQKQYPQQNRPAS